MSLQQMSWRNVKRLSRVHGQPFIAVAAHHSHGKIAIDINGDTWWIDGDGCQPDDQSSTTTSQYLKTGLDYGLSAEWIEELTRRRRELQT